MELLISRREALKRGGSIAAVGGLAGCMRAVVPLSSDQDPIVDFESLSEQFFEVVDTNQRGKLLSVGHKWSEGPAWDRHRQVLYFTDVPGNKAFRWSEKDGVTTFLDPSGVLKSRSAGFREPGANGLLLSRSGALLICNHGNRSVEAMDIAAGSRNILADRFDGMRFNSPNDLIEAADGSIFFTDPPYGLEGLDESPLKQMKVNGVYRLDQQRRVTRLVADMTFPNGVALSPDESWLYVSQSDPQAPLIRRFPLSERARKVDGAKDPWFDARPFMHPIGGLPDGMAVAATGHIFLAGPGGVLVITPNGRCLGRILTGRATANCAFGHDGRTLFIAAADRLLSVRTRIEGAGAF